MSYPATDDAQQPALSLQGKRFLVVSALFPPDIIGGAEMSANNLTQWLKKNGAEVGVLTSAKTPEEACEGKNEHGLKIWRVWMPRFYPMYNFATAKSWQKPIWHLQDHFDPRNRKIAARVLDAFKPDFVNVHVLQGLGYNMLKEVGKRGIPTVYFLHDLSLACFRTGMFKNGASCARHCAPCKLSAKIKAGYAQEVPALRFCSPSQANLDKLARYFPVKEWPHTSILNANRYPAPKAARVASDRLRLLYVGRLHSTKGIQLLLKVADNLSAAHRFTLTVVGTGPDEAELRREYGDREWCKFSGFITQAEISDIMVNSDLFCIPSAWAENSPGVAIHALSQGLPVFGSDTGGIPELVDHEKNGLLIPANDPAAWENALRAILADPSRLRPWRAYAEAHAPKFDQDYLGAKIMEFSTRIDPAS